MIRCEDLVSKKLGSWKQWYLILIELVCWTYATWTETDRQNEAWSMDQQKWWLKRHSDTWRREIPAQSTKRNIGALPSTKDIGDMRPICIDVQKTSWWPLGMLGGVKLMSSVASLTLAGARETWSGFKPPRAPTLSMPIASSTREIWHQA